MVLFSAALAVSLAFSLFEFKGVSEKVGKIFFALGSVLLFVLMGLNRLNPDYEGYYGSFYNGNSNHEIGYQLLNKLFKALHLPFETLMLLMAGLLIAVLWIGLKGHVSSWVIFFYTVFPLALDLPQMRNTFMYLIVILALLLFANRSRIAFFASVLVAASMHILGAMYLPLTFILKVKRKTFFKWLAVFTLGLFAAVIGVRVVNSLFTLNKEIVEEIKVIDRFFFATQLLEISIDLFTYWWLDRKLKDKLDPRTGARMESLYRFGWYTVLYLPLLLISSQMYRFRRNAQLVKYVYSGIAMKYLNRKDQLILVGLIAINLVLVIVFMVMADDHSVYTWFDYNWLFTAIRP
jgi:hypothetical protein